MYLMWRHRRNGSGSLSTPKQLVEQLVTGEFSNLGLDVKILPAEDREKKARKVLRQLAEQGLAESGPAPKENESAPGPPPSGYRLPEEGKTITWPSTARLILELFNYPERPVDRQRFLNEAVKFGLWQDDTGEQSSDEQVVQQIEYCIRKGYLAPQQSTSHAGTIATLQCTSLVDQHLSLLKMFALEGKRPVAKETGTQSIVSDANVPVGGGSQK